MRRKEEVGAKVKLLNCFVLAIVLLSVSALSGAVVCAAEEHPSGPVPTEITVTVDPQSILADGTTQSTITACAMDNDEASGGYILTFEIEEGPDDVELIPVLDGGSYSDTAVWDETDENGYAYAKLKAGTTEGQVTIKVFHLLVSGTAGVTLKEPGQSDQFEMPLVEGWNLISIPLQMDNNSINAVFTNASNEDVLFAYDDGGWITATYYSGYGWDGDLETIELDKGYWYGANSAYTVTIEGTEAGTRDASITTGWNLIGYTRQNEAGLNDLIPNASNEDVLFAYDDGGWITATYYSGYGWDGDLAKMEPGKGYWYGANEAFTWEY